VCAHVQTHKDGCIKYVKFVISLLLGNTEKPKGKRTGGVAQVLEFLPSKCKVLSSKSSVKQRKLN
jgi:hypothetical protein